MTDDLTATENARDIALASAAGFAEDRDRWERLADEMATVMSHSDRGICTMTKAEHATLAKYHAMKPGRAAPLPTVISGEAGNRPPPPPPPDKG